MQREKCDSAVSSVTGERRRHLPMALFLVTDRYFKDSTVIRITVHPFRDDNALISSIPRRWPLLLCHEFHSQNVIFLTQPWESAGNGMRGLTRVTPVGIEEVMESKPYGIEVSLVMVATVAEVPF